MQSCPLVTAKAKQQLFAIVVLELFCNSLDALQAQHCVIIFLLCEGFQQPNHNMPALKWRVVQQHDQILHYMQTTPTDKLQQQLQQLSTESKLCSKRSKTPSQAGSEQSSDASSSDDDASNIVFDPVHAIYTYGLSLSEDKKEIFAAGENGALRLANATTLKNWMHQAVVNLKITTRNALWLAVKRNFFVSRRPVNALIDQLFQEQGWDKPKDTIIQKQPKSSQHTKVTAAQLAQQTSVLMLDCTDWQIIDPRPPQRPTLHTEEGPRQAKHTKQASQQLYYATILTMIDCTSRFVSKHFQNQT